MTRLILAYLTSIRYAVTIEEIYRWIKGRKPNVSLEDVTSKVNDLFERGILVVINGRHYTIVED